MSGPGPASGVAKSPAEFAHEVGLVDGAVANELFSACGGRIVLGRAAASAMSEAAAGESASKASTVSQDVSSSSFADYVASFVPDLDLGVTAADARHAAALSYLSRFTRQTALMVVSVVEPQTDGIHGPIDPEGVLMRLRMAGVLVPAQVDDERRTYRIPSLIAGCLRRQSVGHSVSSPLVISLVDALVDHLRGSQLVDAHILDDALSLSRRFEQWKQLARIQESVGLPMFLIAPHAVCTAFGHLPAQALNSTPELGFLAALTDDVLDRLANGSAGADIRAVVMQETRAGRMRGFFPGALDRGGGAVVLATERWDEPELLSDPTDLLRSGPDGGTGSELALVQSGRADFISTMSRMIALTRNGHHENAAVIGLAWSAREHGRWARLVVRLLTAICFFHSCDFRRAISILSEIEPDAVRSHVGGDFLLPAVTAWTALASVVSGDHERADRALSGLDDEMHNSLLVEEIVRPAGHVASALRALDRLDLESAQKELTALSFCPETCGLWTHLPAIGRTLAILTASTESSLLFVNDDVERYRDPSAISATGRDLLAASRSMVFISLGQLKWAEVELKKMSPTSDARIVLEVRVELVAGRLDSAVALADTWFYHSSFTPAKRAELAAIKAAALLRLGRRDEAADEFVTAVGLSAWVNSLLPVALLPQADRNQLLDLTAGHEIWVEAFKAFSVGFRNFDELGRRLRSVGSIAVGSATMPQLTSGEAQLLDLLARGLSVYEMSQELHQVTGTVKNRLSALYRKFGVSNRSEVVTRARSLGFLTP